MVQPFFSQPLQHLHTHTYTYKDVHIGLTYKYIPNSTSTALTQHVTVNVSYDVWVCRYWELMEFFWHATNEMEVNQWKISKSITSHQRFNFCVSSPSNHFSCCLFAIIVVLFFLYLFIRFLFGSIQWFLF